MESFKQFLDTASINGLNHIASTRKWTRLFWINLVTLGFVVSTFLIWESFQSWTDNPVRTTTKTVPMTEIKFPKLTVCPPKDTFTDLNYDLMLTEHVTITKDKRDELYEYVVELIDENVYMDPWDKIHEENRFLNWYTGFTSMHEQPYYGELFYKYTVVTSATSGVITSQYFRESYDPKLLENRFAYVINVFPARSIRYNKNVTLHFKLEKLTLPVATGFDDMAISDDEVYEGLSIVDPDAKLVYKSFNPPTGTGKQVLDANREITDSEIADLNMNMMPGFQFSWYYTGIDFTPDPLLDFPAWKKLDVYLIRNNDFIREANENVISFLFNIFFRFVNLLFEANLDQSILWTHVKAARSEFRKKRIFNADCKAFVTDEERKANFDNLKKHLKVANSTDEVKSLPGSIIEEGGKMFVYLNSCPALHWQNFYHHLLFSKPNSEMILLVLNAMKNSRTKGGRTVANKFLGRLVDILGFEYKIVVNETMWVNNIATVKGKNRRFL